MVSVLSDSGSGFVFGRSKSYIADLIQVLNPFYSPSVCLKETTHRCLLEIFYSLFILFLFLLRFLSRVCIACRRQGYDWAGKMLEGENVSACEWLRYRSLLGYNLRTIFSFTPALRGKPCPRPAASDVRALTCFTQECSTSYPLLSVKPSMKSEEGCDDGDVFGQKWY